MRWSVFDRLSLQRILVDRGELTVVKHPEKLVQCCDATEFLRDKCPAGVASLVVIDPPGQIGVQHEETSTPLEEMLEPLTQLASEVRTVLEVGGATLAIGGIGTITAWEMAATWAGLYPVGSLTVVWDVSRKRHSSSLTTHVRWHVRPGRRHHITKSVQVISNVVIAKPVPDDIRTSPSQLPVELYNYLISLFCRKGELVIDPFCDNGSSLVAGLICERRVLGCDSDPAKCKLAVARLKTLDMELENLQPLKVWSNGKTRKIEG